VLNAQDTGCGHHLGSPPPAFVCRVVAARVLAELIPEKRVIYPSRDRILCKNFWTIVNH